MTDTDPFSGLNPDKVRALLLHAMTHLDPDDIIERVKLCNKTGQHGARMKPDGDLMEFTWGNRRLCLVHREVVTGPGLLDLGMLEAEFHAEDEDITPEDIIDRDE
jgi:hypothetical protein